MSDDAPYYNGLGTAGDVELKGNFVVLLKRNSDGGAQTTLVDIVAPTPIGDFIASREHEWGYQRAPVTLACYGPRLVQIRW